MLLVLGEQVSQVVVSKSRHQMIDHVESLLSDMLQLHLLGPVEIFYLLDVHLHSWVTLFVVIQARFELLKLEGRRVKKFIEVVAELPNVQDPLELFRTHADLHRHWLGFHDAAMQLWHLLNQSVWNRVSHRVTLDVLRVQLAKDLELLLNELISLDFLPLCRRQYVLCLHSLALLRLESSLS